MSQAIDTGHPRLLPAATAGLASFILLSAIFVATMLVHYRAIDPAYLLFALLRISAISLVTAAIAAISARYLRSLLGAVAFGTATGMFLGVAYVVAAT